MSLKYGILNFLVFVIIIVLISKTYEIWTSPHEIFLEKEVIKKSAGRIENPTIGEEKRESSKSSSCVVISEKNIFNPERRNFPTQSGPEWKRPIVRPQIILYGVMMAGDYQCASIANPGRPLKKGER